MQNWSCIGRFEAANKEDAVLAVRYCACLSADAVKRCLASLENTHGVISYNDASHRFAMYAEANGRNDYKRVFLRHLNEKQWLVLLPLGQEVAHAKCSFIPDMLS